MSWGLWSRPLKSRQGARRGRSGTVRVRCAVWILTGCAWLACLSTFAYHAIQVFDLNPYYHLKSNTCRRPRSMWRRIWLHAVRMPLFFLISGMVGFTVAQRLSDA